VIDDIRAARDHALAQIDAASSLDEVAALDARLLGKKGDLAQLKARLGGLASVDEKRAAGQAVNEALTGVADALRSRRRELAESARAARVAAERLDLTEYAGRASRGHAHVVTQAWEHLEDLFIGLGFQVVEGPEVETDWHNFEALNMGEGHPARGEFDTLFVDHVAPGGAPGHTVLRTHTSPVQIRAMQSMEPPIYVVAPGRVFRATPPTRPTCRCSTRSRGWSSTGTSRWRTWPAPSRPSPRRSSARSSPRACDPRTSRSPSRRPSSTSPADGGWLELGGCGMVHPNVLRAGGIDPEQWSGFAFGFGIDRMAVMRHGIADLREMFTNDMRFIEQF
jgi:phenylalanyl-tRNA synthetase alpha chain